MKTSTVLSAVSKVFLTFITIIHPGHGARVLLIAPFGSTSHSLTCHQVGEALASRGHEVHQIVSTKFKSQSPVQFLEVQNTGTKLWQEFSLYPHGDHRLNQFPVIWLTYLKALIRACQVFWEEPIVLDLVSNNSTMSKYDVIVMDALLQECTLPLAYKLEAPVVFMSANLLDPHTAWSLGIPTPHSHIPQFFAELTAEMSFKERVMNMVTHLSYVLLHQWYYLPSVRSIAQEKVGPLPPLEDVVKNVSGAMAAADKGVFLPSRPMMPHFIDIAGITCRPSKSLPQDLEDLVNSSGDNGFILFSLGTIVESNYFPPNVLQSFMDAFARIDQLVLLKHKGDTTGFPPNVKALNWLPQQDLLGHPKIRLFISHGGMHGLYEAIYHGVPIVGIGIYTDQRPNMIRSVERGFAVELQENNITTESVYEAVHAVLTNPSYTETAKELSQLHRDEPQTPMERAVDWIEFVTRHKGAPHLHNTAADLNLMEYFLVDVLSLSVLVTCVGIWAIFKLLDFTFRKSNITVWQVVRFANVHLTRK